MHAGMRKVVTYEMTERTVDTDFFHAPLGLEYSMLFSELRPSLWWKWLEKSVFHLCTLTDKFDLILIYFINPQGGIYMSQQHKNTIKDTIK